MMKTPVPADAIPSDPFAGKFDRAKQALSEVLQSHYSGTLAEAMRVGNTAVMALRLLTGDYDVSETSFRITTENHDR